MSSKRFDLALELIRPEGWAQFESFASKFLVNDFPTLRTLASPSGDEGRDAHLYSPEGNDAVALQYSVAAEWKAKVRQTANKIAEKFPKTRVLVYVTNQRIGAAADQLKSEIQEKHQLYLDVRDRSWFVDRFFQDPGRSLLIEELAKAVVDPYIAGDSVLEQKGVALSELESKAAFLFLSLQWEDDSRDKGLTKTAFEALVRSTLRNTDSDNRLGRSVVRERICSQLPSHPEDAVNRFVDSALRRLTKNYIRHWKQADEFCLTHDEKLRTSDRITEMEYRDALFSEDIYSIVRSYAGKLAGIKPEEVESLCDRVRRAIELFMYDRGEIFVEALMSGRADAINLENLKDIVLRDVNLNPPKQLKGQVVDLLISSVGDILSSSRPETRRYLRSLADTYTLCAFLRETPDIQAATNKMFSHGDIWVDTTALLPLFSETLLPDESRIFSQIVSAATRAGIGLRMTRGVVEEVETHMGRCLACARIEPDRWNGTAPFLFSEFVSQGRPRSEFASWIERFRGESRPEDDIADYLSEHFGIKIVDLANVSELIEEDIRYTVKEAWISIHTKRRERHGYAKDSILINRLAEHDAENYLGVIANRRQEKSSPFGYSCWWLTLDRFAFQIEQEIRATLGREAPPTPVMSADFLLNYLALGPIRSRVPRETQAQLPVGVDPGLVEYLTPDLLELAEQVRRESQALPEYVIRRRVRDKLDDAKKRLGRIALGGLSSISGDAFRQGDEEAVEELA